MQHTSCQVVSLTRAPRCLVKQAWYSFYLLLRDERLSKRVQSGVEHSNFGASVRCSNHSTTGLRKFYLFILLFSIKWKIFKKTILFFFSLYSNIGNFRFVDVVFKKCLFSDKVSFNYLSESERQGCHHS